MLMNNSNYHKIKWSTLILCNYLFVTIPLGYVCVARTPLQTSFSCKSDSIYLTEDLCYYSSGPLSPPTHCSSLSSSLFSPSPAFTRPPPETCARRPLKSDATPPSPPLSSQHGYSRDLDQIHRRVSALRGTGKVSDRHRSRRCCGCCCCCVLSARARVHARALILRCCH